MQPQTRRASAAGIDTDSSRQILASRWRRQDCFGRPGNGDGSLMPVTVELPLSNDPVLRSKQVLNTLLAGPVDVELRTLPPDAVLLAFYLLPDGTAIADFSEALATATPSGIQSEQMAVDSITQNAGSECATRAAAEDFDSRTGSGYAGGASGSDAERSW